MPVLDAKMARSARSPRTLVHVSRIHSLIADLVERTRAAAGEKPDASQLREAFAQVLDNVDGAVYEVVPR